MIKKLLTLIVVCSLWIPLGCETSNVYGAIYFVKNGGSDAADGLSDGNAWETIAKVNSDHSSGDTVNLKKGSTWVEILTPKSGTPGNETTIQAYGSGNIPQVKRITFFAFPSKSWIVVDGIKASSDSSDSIVLEAANNIIIQNCEFDGQGTHAHDVVTIRQKEDVPSFNITIDNCLIENGGITDADSFGGGVQVARNTHDITVKDSTLNNNEEFQLQAFSLTTDSEAFAPYNILFKGNTIFKNDAVTGRGINIGWNVKSIIVERNDIEGNRFGIGFDSANTIPTAQLIARNNVVYNCIELCVILANSSGNSNNSQVLNNTFIAGPATVKGVWYRSTSGSTGTGHVLKNNIIDGSLANPNALFREELLIETGHTVDSDYNIFHDDAGELINYHGTEYTDDFAGYQAASGLDANSLTTDPLLDANYRLKANSPAINTGTDVGMGNDYYGNIRRSPFEIGAVEHCTSLKNCVIFGAIIQ